MKFVDPFSSMLRMTRPYQPVAVQSAPRYWKLLTNTGRLPVRPV
jgi:hypothetical protein